MDINIPLKPEFVRHTAFDLGAIAPQSIVGWIELGLAAAIILAAIAALIAYRGAAYAWRGAIGITLVAVVFPFAAAALFVVGTSGLDFHSKPPVPLFVSTQSVKSDPVADEPKLADNVARSVEQTYGLHVVRGWQAGSADGGVDGSIIVSKSVDGHDAKPCDVKRVSGDDHRVKAVLLCSGSEPKKVRG